MSIVMGALGGVGESMQKIGDTNQKAWLEQDLQTSKAGLDRETHAINSGVDLQRQQTLEQYKATLGNTQREAQVSRIDTAAGKIADAEVDKKRGIVQGGIADKEAWTPEQQAAVDQSLGNDRSAIAADQQTRTKAAIATGDISPKDAMLDSSRQELGMAKLDAQLAVQSARTEAMNAKTQAQYEVGMAKVEAALAKAGAGNTDFDKKVSLLRQSGASDKEIANFITERKQPSLEDLANGFLRADPNAGSKKQMTPEEAYEKAKQLRSLTTTLGEEKEPKPDAPKPAPGKPLGSLPAGARQVGTSNGKPVYETPDGKRFIQN